MKPCYRIFIVLLALFVACSDGQGGDREISIVSVSEANSLLREVIVDAMRSEVFPGGTPSGGCYTWDHKKRFDAGGKGIRSIVAAAEENADFVTALASLRVADVTELSDDLGTPIYPTWAMQGRIDDTGTTDAGYEVQQDIGREILKRATQLLRMSDEEWRRFLEVHGFKMPFEEEQTVIPGQQEGELLRFSEWEWEVKSSSGPVGPGPCVFNADNALVDDEGRLRLRITQSRNGMWTCGEVICRSESEPFGYGTYTWEISDIRTPDIELDPSIVIGMFTWSDTLHYDQEIDIEIGRWGEKDGLPYQYVVQPWDVEGNRYRFDGPISAGLHQIIWEPGRIRWLSRFADGREERWSYEGPDVPTPGGAVHPRINVWLLDNVPPAERGAIEVVFDRFGYEAL